MAAPDDFPEDMCEDIKGIGLRIWRVSVRFAGMEHRDPIDLKTVRGRIPMADLHRKSRQVRVRSFDRS